MPCTPFKIGEFSGIVCTRGPRRKPKLCACGAPGTLLCDWKVGKRTCDKPLCASHGLRVAPEKHLCPEHQRAYERWKAARPAVQESAP